MTPVELKDGTCDCERPGGMWKNVHCADAIHEPTAGISRIGRAGDVEA